MRKFGGTYKRIPGMFRANDFYSLMCQDSFDKAIKALGEKTNIYGMYSEEQARRIIAHHHATNRTNIASRRLK